MATKIQKMYGTICSNCSYFMESDSYGDPPMDFNYCPKCGAEFQAGPLSASNTTSNLPQSGVKY